MKILGNLLAWVGIAFLFFAPVFGFNDTAAFAGMLFAGCALGIIGGMCSRCKK